MHDFIIAFASLLVVAVSIMAGIWLDDRKRRKTRDMYRDVDFKKMM